MWGQEQKSINLRRDKIFKFTKPGNLVLDACCGTIGTDRERLLPRQQLRFVGFERNLSCVGEAAPSVVQTFASQLLSHISDLTAPEV